MDYKEYRRQFAKSGGDAVLKKHGKEHFKLMGKLSAEARRKKKTAKSPKLT